MPESTLWLQIPVFLAGVASAYLAFTRPDVIPDRFWKRAFTLRYFGTALIFATLWGVSVLLSDEVFPIVPLTLATSFASTLSFLNAPRIP
jgi:hypothetical protein